MLYFLVFALFASARSERVHVVTPESRIPESGEKTTEDDSYVMAYEEMHNIVRERRNPLGSYTEDYNTVSHSSFIEDDVYPELNYKVTEYHKPYHHYHHHHKHQHSSPSFIYGPPRPISHHHHPDHSSSHHTVIDFPSPLEILTVFLHKFGLQKVIKIIVKIAVLKVILKFVTVIALFVVLPALLPAQEKEDSDDDSLLKSLNDVTNKVWNGITVRQKIEVVDHQQQPSQEIQQKPPEIVTHQPNQTTTDKDMYKDKCMDKDKCMNKETCKDNCKDKDKTMDKDKCKGKEKKKNKRKDNGELDAVDQKLLTKLIKQWKDENFGGPDKSSAISFLRNCVSAVNRILGFLLGYLKMKNGNMDALDGMIFHRFSIYMKHFAKMWPHFMSGWKL